MKWHAAKVPTTLTADSSKNLTMGGSKTGLSRSDMLIIIGMHHQFQDDHRQPKVVYERLPERFIRQNHPQ